MNKEENLNDDSLTNTLIPIFDFIKMILHLKQ